MVQYDSESCFSSDIVTGTLESEQTSNEISCITPGYTHCYAKDAVIYLPSNVSIVSVILSDCLIVRCICIRVDHLLKSLSVHLKKPS